MVGDTRTPRLQPEAPTQESLSEPQMSTWLEVVATTGDPKGSLRPIRGGKLEGRHAEPGTASSLGSEVFTFTHSLEQDYKYHLQLFSSKVLQRPLVLSGTKIMPISEVREKRLTGQRQAQDFLRIFSENCEKNLC